jgi:hypothetical protein
MFSDPKLSASLAGLFSAETTRFDQLLLAAGLDPTKDLVGADLKDAIFDGSIMDGWDLSRCDLTGASFAGARVRNLMTTDAVGLNLAGAEPLEDELNLESPPSDELSSLIEHIEKGTRGKERWPFLERLLRDHTQDQRAWKFLLDRHLRRERVAKHVSWIVREWELTQAKSEPAGNDLRLKLLRRGGSPYITVRARLLKELAARVGPTDDVFEISKAFIEEEGYWTSGLTAMSILAELFSGNIRAATVLKEVISRPNWVGSIADIVAALFKGFDGLATRNFVENAIVDVSRQKYQRASMLTSYARHCDDRAAVRELAIRLFDVDKEPEVRAAATDVRAKFGDLFGPNTWKELQTIARQDRDYQVRSAALRALRVLDVDQTSFFLERAEKDENGTTRATALWGLETLGYKKQRWYSQIFARDPDDFVRRSALNWLLKSEDIKDEMWFRDLLIGELGQKEPSLAAARAADVLMARWPNDPEIPHLVIDFLARCPKEISGWSYSLRETLRNRGYNTL